MKATELFAHAELLRHFSKEQALGFIVEFVPRHRVVELDRYSTDPRIKKLVRTTIKNLNSVSKNLDSETLLILDATGSEFYNELTNLSQLPCFDIGIVINRSFHLWNFSLPHFRGFYHFPVSETFEEVHWSLDEIFLFLKQLRGSRPEGPPWYQIFDPAWKYLRPPFSQSESRFNTSLNIQAFPQAYADTLKSANFRRLLSKTSTLEKYLFELLTVIYFETPKQFKASRKTIRSTVKAPFIAFKKRIEPLWKVSEQYWCKFIYWPLEYHIRNRGTKFSNEEYEAMKALEVQKRAEEKRLALLRKR